MVPAAPVTLGDHIRLGRYAKQLSLLQLAIQIGVRRRIVSRWEKDMAIPTDEERQKLESVLGVLPLPNPT